MLGAHQRQAEQAARERQREAEHALERAAATEEQVVKLQSVNKQLTKELAAAEEAREVLARQFAASIEMLDRAQSECANMQTIKDKIEAALAGERNLRGLAEQALVDSHEAREREQRQERHRVREYERKLNEAHTRFSDAGQKLWRQLQELMLIREALEREAAMCLTSCSTYVQEAKTERGKAPGGTGSALVAESLARLVSDMCVAGSEFALLEGGIREQAGQIELLESKLNGALRALAEEVEAHEQQAHGREVLLAEVSRCQCKVEELHDERRELQADLTTVDRKLSDTIDDIFYTLIEAQKSADREVGSRTSNSSAGGVAAPKRGEVTMTLGGGGEEGMGQHAPADVDNQAATNVSAGGAEGEGGAPHLTDDDVQALTSALVSQDEVCMHELRPPKSISEIEECCNREKWLFSFTDREKCRVALIQGTNNYRINTSETRSLRVASTRSRSEFSPSNGACMCAMTRWWCGRSTQRCCLRCGNIVCLPGVCACCNALSLAS